jgi:hypothetical protein
MASGRGNRPTACSTAARRDEAHTKAVSVVVPNRPARVAICRWVSVALIATVITRLLAGAFASHASR